MKGGLLIIALLFTQSLNAQSISTDGQEQPLIQYGDFVGYGVRSATLDELLKKPRIKCLLPKCKVTGFDIYGITSGSQYIGPYQSTTDTMTGSQIRYIKSLGPTCQLWISNIHIKDAKGKETIIGKGSTEYSIYFFNIR